MATNPVKREIRPPVTPQAATIDPVETSSPTMPRPRLSPAALWGVGGVAGVTVVGLVIWFFATLTEDRTTKIFDLAIAGLVVGLLSCASRYLLRAEALRRSRLVAAELIGVTFGGAALSTVLVTATSDAVGASRIPALIAIQLLAAVLGGAAVFLLAFFVTLLVKGSARLFRRDKPEVEAIFIGLVSGAMGGLLTAEAAERWAWLPFVAAVVCAATTYRAIVLHERYDR
jgi:hypothetical protein